METCKCFIILSVSVTLHACQMTSLIDEQKVMSQFQMNLTYTFPTDNCPVYHRFITYIIRLVTHIANVTHRVDLALHKDKPWLNF